MLNKKSENNLNNSFKCVTKMERNKIIKYLFVLVVILLVQIDIANAAVNDEILLKMEKKVNKMCK